MRDSYAAKDAEWGNVVREGGEIEVDITQVAIGQMMVAGKTSAKVALSEENIDQLFDAAGRSLAAGEGLHRTYWKRFHDKEKPNQAKLELFAVVRQPKTLLHWRSWGSTSLNHCGRNIRPTFKNNPLP